MYLKINMLHKVSWCASNEALFHLVDFSSVVLITHQALLSQKCPFAVVNSQTRNFSMELFCFFVFFGGGGRGGAWTCRDDAHGKIWTCGMGKGPTISEPGEEATGRWVVLGGSPRDFLFTLIFSPILPQHLEPPFVSGVHIVRTKWVMWRLLSSCDLFRLDHFDFGLIWVTTSTRGKDRPLFDTRKASWDT